MNNLRWLRNNANLTLSKLSEMTGLANPVLTRLENGIRPFRQTHLSILTKFFWVSTDFLLGTTDKGIYAINDDAEVESLTIDQVSSNFDKIEININCETNLNGTKTYTIYRKYHHSFDDRISQKEKSIISKVENMDEEQLDKTEKFIDEYILK